jgi:hypothetical protein
VPHVGKTSHFRDARRHADSGGLMTFRPPLGGPPDATREASVADPCRAVRGRTFEPST